ncbi:hypothetical protein RN001_011019 [Aquatica leii]|uniref:Peptidase S1 domain-containing protein n=1 Tax=Aquatica leii TaxID=1421715 RepID=A0AAN7P8M2_9COLE|nr:hypothetical protein RN001_011019 [Aquatica leii]
MSFRTVCSFLVLVTALSNVNAEVDTRIINGMTAYNGYAYMVSLRNYENYHFCGGSIVSKRWVLTSASCLSFPTNFTIMVGTHSLSSGGVRYEVDHFIYHPLFDSTKLIHDAGLIKTTKNIQYTKKVLPIYLARIFPAAGTVGVLTGWGSTTMVPVPNISDKLQELRTTVMEHSVCAQVLSQLGYNLNSGEFCTFENQAGACLLDFGGPIVVQSEQIGILTAASCDTGFPDVYTNIPMIHVNAEVDTRIINGATAYKGYPYMVSLRNYANYHFCGGSIVSRRWVLTSALCLSFTTNFTIMVGTHSLSSGGVTYQVDHFIYHPLFNSTTQIFDAGLIKTTKNIQYSRKVLPIYLARIFPAAGTVGVLTGWGSTTLIPVPNISDKLQELRTTVMEQSVCAQALLQLGYNLDSGQFCTFKNQAGACLLDFGGPIVVHYKQIGILSADKLQSLELELNDPTSKNFLMLFMKKIGGTNGREFVVRNLRKIFVDSFASKTSWCGQRNNIRISNLKLIKLLQDVTDSIFKLTDKRSLRKLLANGFANLNRELNEMKKNCLYLILNNIIF